MFTRERSLDRRRLYTREFLESTISQVSDAGFDEITVMLPHNYEGIDPLNSVISIDEFLKRDRNYAAVILRARSSARDEILKILFVNSSAEAIFADDTYPSTASEPPALFFQSPDPARAYALFEFFHEVLSGPNLARFVIISIGGLISIVFLATQVLVIGSKHRGVLGLLLSTGDVWDWIASILATWLAFRFYSMPTGLWVKPRRELRLLYLAKMAVRGELRDNPIVQLLVTVAGGLIVLIVAKLLGLA